MTSALFNHLLHPNTIKKISVSLDRLRPVSERFKQVDYVEIRLRRFINKNLTLATNDPMKWIYAFVNEEIALFDKSEEEPSFIVDMGDGAAVHMDKTSAGLSPAMWSELGNWKQLTLRTIDESRLGAKSYRTCMGARPYETSNEGLRGTSLINLNRYVPDIKNYDTIADRWSRDDFFDA